MVIYFRRRTPDEHRAGAQRGVEHAGKPRKQAGEAAGHLLQRWPRGCRRRGRLGSARPPHSSGCEVGPVKGRVRLEEARKGDATGWAMKTPGFLQHIWRPVIGFMRVRRQACGQSSLLPLDHSSAAQVGPSDCTPPSEQRGAVQLWCSRRPSLEPAPPVLPTAL